MMRLSNQTWRQLGSLLMPSITSALLALTAGLLVSLGAMAVFAADSSGLQQYLISWQQSQSQSAPLATNQLSSPGRPTLADSWPLIIVWSLVGLVVYFIALSIINFFGRAKSFRDSLNYVNAQPQLQVEEAIEHLVLRTVSAIVLISLIGLFVRDVLPYSLTAARASVSNTLGLGGVLDVLLSFAATAFIWHVMTVFLRLTLGKIRLLGY